MNQYERIVSYIHQYQEGKKGLNVGYVKIEKRGENCRIQVQMRNGYISNPPHIFLFKQLDRTIRTVPVGEAAVKGSEIYYKGNTEVDGMFGSDLSLEDIDGLLVYLNRNYYFATSWKNDSIYLGEWQMTVNGNDYFRDGGLHESKESHEDESEEKSIDKEREIEKIPAKEEGVGEDETAVCNEPADVSDNEEISGQEQAIIEEPKEKMESPEKEYSHEQSEVEAAEAAQVQMRAICGVCPFKRQNVDYGKRILLSFPSMRPFSDEKASECVRLELQDIGCLPMKYWSLSGNRFLLHGYYCYRHLIFCQKETGKYVLGVPGIYSEREQKNACRFGFPSFQSIGGFGKQRGAFGYWMMDLM